MSDARAGALSHDDLADEGQGYAELREAADEELGESQHGAEGPAGGMTARLLQ